MNNGLAILSIMAIALTGCGHVGKAEFDNSQNKVELSALSDKHLVKPFTVDTDFAASPQIMWSNVEDATLSRFIKEALGENLTIESALLRLNSAEIFLEQARTELAPTLRLGDGFINTSSTTDDSLRFIGSMQASANYRVDLWGLVDNNIELSALNRADQETALRATEINIARLIARTYVNIRAQDEFIRLQEQQIDIQKEQLRLSEVRLSAGTITRLNVDQLKVSVSQLESRLESLNTTRESFVRSLAVLMGRPLHSFKMAKEGFIFTDIPRAKMNISVSVITHRPDIKRAERGVMAAGISLDTARKAWLPSVNISGNMSSGGTSITDFLSLNALSTGLNLGASILLYDNGNRKRGISQAEIAQEQALISYEQNLMSALENLKNLYAQQDENIRQIALLKLREEAQNRVTKITGVRYDSGNASAFDLITEQRNDLSVQQANVQAWLTGMQISIDMLGELGVDP